MQLSIVLFIIKIEKGAKITFLNSHGLIFRYYQWLNAILKKSYILLVLCCLSSGWQRDIFDCLLVIYRTRCSYLETIGGGNHHLAPITRIFNKWTINKSFVLNIIRDLMNYDIRIISLFTIRHEYVGYQLRVIIWVEVIVYTRVTSVIVYTSKEWREEERKQYLRRKYVILALYPCLRTQLHL